MLAQENYVKRTLLKYKAKCLRFRRSQKQSPFCCDYNLMQNGFPVLIFFLTFEKCYCSVLEKMAIYKMPFYIFFQACQQGKMRKLIARDLAVVVLQEIGRAGMGTKFPLAPLSGKLPLWPVACWENLFSASSETVLSFQALCLINVYIF